MLAETLAEPAYRKSVWTRTCCGHLRRFAEQRFFTDASICQEGAKVDVKTFWGGISGLVPKYHSVVYCLHWNFVLLCAWKPARAGVDTKPRCIKVTSNAFLLRTHFELTVPKRSSAFSQSTILALIPGGCTSKLQPLDVLLNKPFKQVCIQEFTYCRSQLSTMPSSADHHKTASKQEVCQWLIKAQDHLCSYTAKHDCESIQSHWTRPSIGWLRRQQPTPSSRYCMKLHGVRVSMDRVTLDSLCS